MISGKAWWVAGMLGELAAFAQVKPGDKVFDDSIRGRTDQFGFRFRKP